MNQQPPSTKGRPYATTKDASEQRLAERNRRKFEEELNKDLARLENAGDEDTRYPTDNESFSSCDDTIIERFEH